MNNIPGYHLYIHIVLTIVTIYPVSCQQHLEIDSIIRDLSQRSIPSVFRRLLTIIVLFATTFISKDYAYYCTDIGCQQHRKDNCLLRLLIIAHASMHSQISHNQYQYLLRKC